MWLNLVEKSITVKSIFKNDEVTLDEIRLYYMGILVHNGWTLGIGFDVKQYPSSPPIKWQKDKCNTIRIGLDLLDNEILFFQNSDFSLEKGDLVIEEDGIFKKVTFIASKSRLPVFICRCRWILVSGISAFINEEGEENY